MDRLAHRTAQVGLERVAETAVVVLVGAQRVHDVLGCTPGEAALEQPPIDQAGVAEQEVVGQVEVDVCHGGRLGRAVRRCRKEHCGHHPLEHHPRLVLASAVQRAQVLPTRPRQRRVERVEQLEPLAARRASSARPRTRARAGPAACRAPLAGALAPRARTVRAPRPRGGWASPLRADVTGCGPSCRCVREAAGQGRPPNAHPRVDPPAAPRSRRTGLRGRRSAGRPNAPRHLPARPPVAPLAAHRPRRRVRCTHRRCSPSCAQRAPSARRSQPSAPS